MTTLDGVLKMIKKKPAKKKSLSSQIKNLRLQSQKWEKYHEDQWQISRDLRYELNNLKSLLPLKYFKINFRIKSNDGFMVEVSEIIDSYSAEMAIKELKKQKTHPSTFELLDIKQLA